MSMSDRRRIEELEREVERLRRELARIPQYPPVFIPFVPAANTEPIKAPWPPGAPPPFMALTR